jgi:hypothetical protein
VKKQAPSGARLCFFRPQKILDDDSHVANATASLPATMHDRHTSNEFEMILSS